MEAAQQQLLRQIIKRVHPDLFHAHPFEMKANSESLQALNAYADQLAAHQSPRPAELQFYVRAPGGGGSEALMTLVNAVLGSDGDLWPLFAAFGLAEEAEAQGLRGQIGPRQSLGAWLRSCLSDAAKKVEEHAALESAITDMRMQVERTFKLAHLQLVNEHPLQATEQRLNLGALCVLRTALEAEPDRARFEGIRIRLGIVHMTSHQDGVLAPPLCRLNEEGVLQVMVPMVGDAVEPAALKTLVSALAATEASRARLLARVAGFWRQRAWDLEPALADVLQVKSVACYGSSMRSHQAFVLWAGTVLRARVQIEQQRLAANMSSSSNGNTATAHHGFGLLIFEPGQASHNDPSTPLDPSSSSPPMLEPVPGSAYVQVRADCPWPVLVEFLASHGASDADRAAQLVEAAREKEARALEAARQALGVRSLLRLCATEEEASDAAARLEREAPRLRRSLPQLASISIALDDGYRLWDSGLVSIPHDFSCGAELVPELVALLDTSSRRKPQAAAMMSRRAGGLAPCCLAVVGMRTTAARTPQGLLREAKYSNRVSSFNLSIGVRSFSSSNRTSCRAASAGGQLMYRY